MHPQSQILSNLLLWNSQDSGAARMGSPQLSENCLSLVAPKRDFHFQSAK